MKQIKTKTVAVRISEEDYKTLKSINTSTSKAIRTLIREHKNHVTKD